MKRKHVVFTSSVISQQSKCMIIMQKDLQKMVSDFGIDIMLTLQQSCKYAYAQGGLMTLRILDYAIKTKNNPIMERAARTSAPIDVMWHPLYWQNLLDFVKAPPSFSDTPCQIIQRQFDHFVDSGVVKKLSSYAETGCVVAGGFVRALVIQALRSHTWTDRLVAKHLSDQFLDIDVFCNSLFESKNVLLSTTDISDNVPVQKVCPGTELCLSALRSNSFWDFMITFDYTCTQATLIATDDVDENGHQRVNLRVTPAFIYSIMTGKIYLTYFNRIKNAWPFNDTLIVRLSSSGNVFIAYAHKLVMYRRYAKYRGLGYIDIHVDDNAWNVMRDLITQTTSYWETNAQIDEYVRHFDFIGYTFSVKEK